MPTPSKAVLDCVKAKVGYDPSSGELWRVFANGNKRALGSYKSSTGFRLVTVNNTQLLAHRVAWFLETGDWPDGQLVFVDNDCDNLKFDNLELRLFACCCEEPPKTDWDKNDKQ